MDFYIKVIIKIELFAMQLLKHSLQILSNTSKYGCDRCDQKLVVIKRDNEKCGRPTYPSTKLTDRTVYSFRNKLQIDHHKGNTPFVKLNINMTYISADYMHCCLFGVMRKFLNVWICR